jgi:hypothetical protein
MYVAFRSTERQIGDVSFLIGLLNTLAHQKV